MGEEIKGIIFDIQHFSLGDGPGIRTTVFLKGCPLKCEWCHNPESQESRPQVMYHRSRCVLCGACASVCPTGCHKTDGGLHAFHSEKCIGCGRCIAACPFGSLEIAGRKISVEEIIAEVKEDQAFYEEGQGGLTLSGGEPLYQPEFTLALAKAAKEQGIHVCVETSGFGKQENLLTLAKYTNLFLYDYKATGDDHKRLTGVENGLILRNLKALDGKGCQIILRCPMIPGRNWTQAHVEAIIGLGKDLKNLRRIELLPYHSLGIGKREILGLPAVCDAIEPPTKESMGQLANRIEAETQIETTVM